MASGKYVSTVRLLQTASGMYIATFYLFANCWAEKVYMFICCIASCYFVLTKFVVTVLGTYGC